MNIVYILLYMGFLEELFRLKFEQPLERERRRKEEALTLFLLLEFFTLENPLKYYALELYPLILEEFHRLHRSLGYKHSPLDWIRCC